MTLMVFRCVGDGLVMMFCCVGDDVPCFAVLVMTVTVFCCVGDNCYSVLLCR